MLFGSITQEPLAYLNFDAIFEFLKQLTIEDTYIIFQKDVDNFEIERKTCRAVKSPCLRGNPRF